MPLIEKIVNFSIRYRVLAHVLFWLAVYILQTGSFDPYDPYESPFSKHMINSLFYTLFAIAAAYFLAYRILPQLLKAHNYFYVTLEFLAGAYVIGACSRLLVVYVLEPMVRTGPFSQESVGEILTDLPKLFWSYFIQTGSLAFVFIFLKLVKDQYLNNKRTLELEKQKSDSELKALKAQLNPHFLFNTLNNIYSLSLMNAPQTSGSIARLSEILDHLLYRSSGTYVPVSQEIALVHNYIELEKLRYDDRLQVNFQHTTDRDVNIAPLLLLSLVENAFKHGAGEDAGSPVISIQLQQVKNTLSIEITNTFRPAPEKDEGLRIGLANIRKQLELIYPASHTFDTYATGNTYIARLHITLKDQ